MAPKELYRLPDWFLAHNVKLHADIQDDETQIEVGNYPAKESDLSGKHNEDAKCHDGQDPANLRISQDEYSELRNAVVASLATDPNGNLLEYQPAILLRASTLVDSLDPLVSRLGKDTGASIVSVGHDDLCELGWHFDSQEKLENRCIDAKRHSGIIYHVFSDRCKRHSNSERRERRRKALTSVLSSLKTKYQKNSSSNESKFMEDKFLVDVAALFDESPKKSDVTEEDYLVDIAALFDESSEDDGTSTKEQTKNGEAKTEASDDEREKHVILDGNNGKDTPSEHTGPQSSTESTSFLQNNTTEPQEAGIESAPKAEEKDSSQPIKESETGINSQKTSLEGMSSAEITTSQRDEIGILNDNDKNLSPRKNRPQKPAYDDKGPVIIHMRNINVLLQDKSERKVIRRVLERAREHRNTKKRMVVVCSLSYKEAPMEASGATKDANNNSLKIYDDSKLSTLLGVDETSTVTITALDELNDMLKAKTIRELNINDLQQHLGRKLDPQVPVKLLRTKENWQFLEEDTNLAFLRERRISELDLRRATKQITGNMQPDLELSEESILAGLRCLPKKLDNEIKAKTADPGAERNKLLDSIRSSCNSEEEELFDCVVDPKKLRSGYDDVIIDPETKKTIEKLVSLYKFRPEGSNQFLLQQVRITGALFYGPPGTGKTHLSRAIAKDSGANMLTIDSAAIESKWVGETEKNIRAAFSLAAKLYPCVLFIDEVDSVFRRRSSDDRSYTRKALTQFLLEMDGLGTSDKAPFVVVATNRPSDLDDAFMRRLPHKVLFKLPDVEQRAQIFRGFLKEEDLDPLVTPDNLAQLTNGYSGSDIRNLCGQAALDWAIEQSEKEEGLGSSQVLLAPKHFAKALKNTQPSVTPKALREFDNFARQFNPKG